jgi:hypothetical protein
MIKVNNKEIEIKTGVLADNKKELVCYFRNVNNSDFISLSLGESVMSLLHDCFLRFNYPVEVEDEKGKKKEYKNLKLLSENSISNDIFKIVTACFNEMASRIKQAQDEAFGIEKK